MVGAIGIPASRGVQSPQMALGMVIPMVAGFTLGGLVMTIGMALSHAATVKAVAEVHLGKQTSIGQAYRALKGRIWRVIGVFLAVSTLSIGGAALLVIIVSVVIAVTVTMAGRAQGGAAAIAGGLLGFLGIVVGAIVAAVIFVRYSLAVQVCVIEDLRVGASLRRSVFLSKGSRGRIVAIYAVCLVLGWIVGAGVAVVAVLVPRAIGPGILSIMMVSLSGFVSGCLTGPLATIGMSLVYYDERVRKEAFDLQLMMAALEPLPQASPAPAQ
jgi:hypothetical protein